MDEKLTKAFLAFTSAMSDLKESYTIKQQFKSYGRSSKVTTVTFMNKSFRGVGDNSLLDALTASIRYLVFNFNKFSDLRDLWLQKEESEGKICKPASFKITKCNIFPDYS